MEEITVFVLLYEDNEPGSSRWVERVVDSIEEAHAQAWDVLLFDQDWHPVLKCCEAVGYQELLGCELAFLNESGDQLSSGGSVSIEPMCLELRSKVRCG